MSEKNICVLGQVVAVWRAEAGTLPSLELYKLNGSGLVVIGEGHLADLRDFLNTQVPGEKYEIKGKSYGERVRIMTVEELALMERESAAWRKAVEDAKEIESPSGGVGTHRDQVLAFVRRLAEGKP